MHCYLEQHAKLAVAVPTGMSASFPHRTQISLYILIASFSLAFLSLFNLSTRWCTSNSSFRTAFEISSSNGLLHGHTAICFGSFFWMMALFVKYLHCVLKHFRHCMQPQCSIILFHELGWPLQLLHTPVYILMSEHSSSYFALY